MNLSEIELTIADQLRQVSGLDVVWKGRPEGGSFVDPSRGARVYLEWISASGPLGEEEYRIVTAFGENGETLGIQTNVCGTYNYVLQLLIESMDPAPVASSWLYAQRVRSALARQSFVDAMNDLGVTIFDYSPANMIPTSFGGRSRSACAFDLSMAIAVNDLDPVIAPFIEGVEIMQHVEE